MSSAWSGRTARGRPPCSRSPAGCSRRPAAASRCSANSPPPAPRSWPGSATSPRTPPCTRTLPSPTTSSSARKLNPRWDHELAQARIDQLGLDPRQKAGKLSGGQRAQLALTVAVAKRPELLILDEPVASLDPLARRDFLRHLMESVAENDTSVILSSHLVSDLERVCDYLIVLVASRVQLAGETEDLLAAALPDRVHPPQSTDLPAGARGHLGRAHRPAVHVHRAQPDRTARRGLVAPNTSSLEDLVLTYMERAADPDRRAATEPTEDAR